jgi:hypothetical protein
MQVLIKLRNILSGFHPSKEDLFDKNRTFAQKLAQRVSTEVFYNSEGVALFAPVHENANKKFLTKVRDSKHNTNIYIIPDVLFERAFKNEYKIKSINLLAHTGIDELYCYCSVNFNQYYFYSGTRYVNYTRYETDTNFKKYFHITDDSFYSLHLAQNNVVYCALLSKQVIRRKIIIERIEEELYGQPFHFSPNELKPYIDYLIDLRDLTMQVKKVLSPQV